jgi:MFS superfamily sulfate permease-like transporter
LSSDIIAGATAAAVVIPQAMGYATVAGLQVEIGLYTCIFPMIVYALLGGSRRLTVDTSVTVMDAMLEVDHHLQRNGAMLWIASIPERAQEKARRAELWEEWVAAGRIHRTVSEAVEAFEWGGA